jgi:hypothetical protein
MISAVSFGRTLADAEECGAEQRPVIKEKVPAGETGA